MRRNPQDPMRLRMAGWIAAAALLGLPLAAQAYVGPGAGLSLLSALWGLLCAIGAAFLFVILWPIRRLRRKRREAREHSAHAQSTPGDSTSQARKTSSVSDTPDTASTNDRPSERSR